MQLSDVLVAYAVDLMFWCTFPTKVPQRPNVNYLATVPCVLYKNAGANLDVI